MVRGSSDSDEAHYSGSGSAAGEDEARPRSQRRGPGEERLRLLVQRARVAAVLARLLGGEIRDAREEVGCAQEVLVREEQVPPEPRPLPRVDEPGLEQPRERLPVHVVHRPAARDELAKPPRVARAGKIHHRWSRARFPRSVGDRGHRYGGW